MEGTKLTQKCALNCFSINSYYQKYFFTDGIMDNFTFVDKNMLVY